MRIENSKIIVQKFGGTSVATHESRLAACQHVESAISDDYRVVIVVSAMGRLGDPYATDTLIGSIGDKAHASDRDLDMLMACGETISAVTFAAQLRSQGHEVTVLNGLQAGIRTDDHHGDAQILEIKPKRIIDALERGNIVVVMGFQGANENGDITTLGRGGSDTTACAMGAAIGADYVDIFTDVDGVMTADPRVVAKTQQLDMASYEEVCQLAYHGAKVIHPYAVEAAMVNHVPIRVRNTRSNAHGTLIASDELVAEQSSFMSHRVVGVASRSHSFIMQFALQRDQDVAIAKLRQHFNDAEIRRQNDHCVVLTPFNGDMEDVSILLNGFIPRPKVLAQCAQVAIVGWGVGNGNTTLRRMLEALSRESIDVHLFDAEENVIRCLVSTEDVQCAVNCLHESFVLDAVDSRVVVGS